MLNTDIWTRKHGGQVTYPYAFGAGAKANADPSRPPPKAFDVAADLSQLAITVPEVSAAADLP